MKGESIKDMGQPRLRGKAYQKKNKSWSWEMVITFGDMDINHPRAIVIGDKRNEFISKDAAIDHMRAASIEISKEIAKANGVSDGELDKIEYLDLTTGAQRLSERQFLKKSKFGKNYFKDK